jgi:Alcohol dehydrogenase GroES-like domain
VRAAIFNEPRNITAGDRPDAAIREPSDAIVRVVLACVCGSDLWYYRGETPFEPDPIGHEFIGVVEDVGADVTTLKNGDLVISPFAFSDGSCPNCQNGITTSCMNGGFFPMNGDGGQGEAVRVPLADTTLVTVPGSGHSDEMQRPLLTLSDVFATGHHAPSAPEGWRLSIRGAPRSLQSRSVGEDDPGPGLRHTQVRKTDLEASRAVGARHLLPRKMSHPVGPVLTSARLCSRSPARRSGSPRPGSPAATEQEPVC